jgi:enoyl-CoA hydratase/carnithine racemase
MNMILTGASISGEEAHHLGLLAAVSEPGTVLDQAVECACGLAAMSTTALSQAKEAVCRGELS